MRIRLLSVWAIVLLGGCRASDTPSALQRLASMEPNAKWDVESLHADFDCDGQLDVAQVGATGDQVIIGIVPAAARQPHLLKFDVEAIVCLMPVHLVWESLSGGPPEDVGPIPGYPESTTCKGLQLAGGDCDSIHVFWNTQDRRFEYWRR